MNTTEQSGSQKNTDNGVNNTLLGEQFMEAQQQEQNLDDLSKEELIARLKSDPNHNETPNERWEDETVDGRIAGLGKEGDLVVSTFEEKCPKVIVELSESQYGERVFVGDKVKVYIKDTTRNVGFGQLMQVIKQEGEIVSKKPKKTEQLEHLKTSVPVLEEHHFSKNADGDYNALTSDGLFEFLKYLNVYEVEE